MSLLSDLYGKVVNLISRINQIEDNAKSNDELPTQAELVLSSKIRVSNGGESEIILVEDIILKAIEATQPYLNRFIETTGIESIGLGITINPNWVWMINGIRYTNLSEKTFLNYYSETGFERIDIIVALENNDFQLINGEEAEIGVDTPVAPTLPINALLVTTIIVGDDTMESPTLPESGYDFLISTDAENTIVLGADGKLYSAGGSGSGGSTPDATTTVKGKAQLATSIEGIAGTNNTKIVTPLVLKAVTDSLLDTGGAFLNALNDYQQASQDFTDAEITTLKDGVATPGNTLQKLYNLILGASSEVYVANIAARDAYDVPQLPFSIFVTDDGDGRWAKYQATTTGVGATFEKTSDPDLLNAVMNAAAIKIAYESNSDTNAFTNALLAKLNGIESVYQVILTATNLGAFTNALTSKTTPIASDAFLIRNSVNGEVEKVTYTNLSATLKAYFDTIYATPILILKRILNSTVESAVVTGTTTETLMYSAPVISAGTFVVDDYFNFRITFRKGPGNSVGCTYRIYVSNTNNFATATLLATWTSSRFNTVIERLNLYFKADNTLNSPIPVATSTQTDLTNTDSALTSISLNPANDIYFFVSAQLGLGTDSTKIVAIKIFN